MREREREREWNHSSWDSPLAWLMIPLNARILSQPGPLQLPLLAPSRKVWLSLAIKLQALVYDILPSTFVFSYAIGSRKLTANEQFFVGAQTVVSLLQTTQIIPDVCFITDHVTYATSNKTKIVWMETQLLLFFFLPGVDASHVYCFHSLNSTQTFWRSLTALVDSCTEIKSAPSVA